MNLTFKLSRDIDKLYILTLLISTLLPKFNTIDSSSVRWLGLALTNSSYIIFYIFHKSKIFVSNKKIISALLFTCLILIASLLVTQNFNDGLITSIKIVLLLITVLCGYNSLNKLENPSKFIAYVFTFCLFIESLYVILDFLFLEVDSLTGISMNSNISSFSILLKLPFLLYIIQLTKSNVFFKTIRGLEIISILSILILQSRAAIVSLLLLYIYLFLFNKSSRKTTLISIFLIISSFALFISSPYADKINTNSINPITLSQDKSFNQRLNNYKLAFDLFSQKPIFGHGIGSWKVKSLKFQDLNNESLFIPYYVHNDFLQFLVELGIVGLALYLLLFVYLIIFSFKSYNMGLYLSASIFIFLIDSNLNFPIHRPQEIVPLLIISLIIISLHKLDKTKFSKLFLIFILIISFVSTYISHKEYKSFVFQDMLLKDYYSKTYTMSFSEISKVNYKMPNLSSNTIPISAYLARYYINTSEFLKAQELINYSILSNPHDVLTKQLQMSLHLTKNKFFDAFEISKELLYNDMNNKLYSEIYFSLIQELKLEEEIINSRLIYSTNNLNIHKLFFDTYIKVGKDNLKDLKSLLEHSIKVHPSEIYFKEIFNAIN
ncbi:O-antigen ligase family protein [Flavobacteriaceae bacterium]|nr:O-antigen ligase family protein [Flavobacteriaceae bacterium]MDC6473171.1 O-antigen ligase family protein [Flavobacteriaceae bacterium]